MPHNAEILKQADKLGRVEPGFHADLVVLSADPLTDTRRTCQMELVIRSGHVTAC